MDPACDRCGAKRPLKAVVVQLYNRAWDIFAYQSGEHRLCEKCAIGLEKRFSGAVGYYMNEKLKATKKKSRKKR